MELFDEKRNPGLDQPLVNTGSSAITEPHRVHEITGYLTEACLAEPC
jgi:hypothetical protein